MVMSFGCSDGSLLEERVSHDLFMQSKHVHDVAVRRVGCRYHMLENKVFVWQTSIPCGVCHLLWFARPLVNGSEHWIHFTLGLTDLWHDWKLMRAEHVCKPLNKVQSQALWRESSGGTWLLDDPALNPSQIYVTIDWVLLIKFVCILVRKKQIYKILLCMLGKNQMCCIGQILCSATYIILV